MSDLRTLSDAFAELERQADAHPLPALPQPARPRFRLVPVAAAVGVLAAGAVWLVPNDNGGPRVGDPPTSSESATTVPGVPTTTDEAIRRLRTVLDGTATVDVTKATGEIVDESTTTEAYVDGEPAETELWNGLSLEGTLTAGGVTGGFDLQISASARGVVTMCDDSDDCVETTDPDGSRLAVGQWPTASGGVTYVVSLIRSDGVYFNMHVSNQRTPRGGSEVLSAEPPLTTEDMAAILTDPRW
ncbi:hypothetical protein [Actinophytocola sp.]|uniref:hypothetical protein n=1 Tax=Actinophytocola sp. TaxID=1872138 RepID=UPI002ED2F340